MLCVLSRLFKDNDRHRGYEKGVYGLVCYLLKKVSMIKKYHNHTLQTNQWQREEKPHDNHQTPGRQTKQIKQD